MHYVDDSAHVPNPANDAPLLPHPGGLGLDLSQAVPFDSRKPSHLVVVPSIGSRRTIVVSEISAELLKSAATAEPLSALVSRLRERDTSVRAADVRSAYELLVKNCRRTLGDRPPASRLFWARRQLLSAATVAKITRWTAALFDVRIAALVLVSACMVPYILIIRPPGVADITSIALGYVFIVAVMLAHEIGHASALARNRAQPGPIGILVYFVWPAFYADVTQSWRLPWRQRIMVDLGGPYLQVLATELLALAYVTFGLTAAGYAVVGSCASLMVNLIPLFKFDGYWFITDILGVRDLNRESAVAMRDIMARRERRHPGAIGHILAAFHLSRLAAWVAAMAWACGEARYRLRLLPEQLADALSDPSAGTAAALTLTCTVAALLISGTTRLIAFAMRSARVRTR